MRRQADLVERVRGYNPGADGKLLNRAYRYAMKAHGSQTRASGDPYFSHPLEVAGILTELKLDDATIATALLHDTIEDTEATREEIDKMFGAEVGALVEGVTKIGKLDLVTKKAEQAENFRKLLLAISDDIRVLLVKLADRLHNMRTLEYVKPEKRKRISEETMDIYAPLAGRIGMQEMRDELEELSLRWLNPQAYETVTERLEALRKRNHDIIERIENELAKKLKKAGIKAEVKSRRKRAYSVWRKMERRQISFEQLSDIFGFRIITKTLEDCYRALGVVHQAWRMVPGRFKDYISTPKLNGYQSIHTTVIGPRYQRVELQIRSKDMHKLADFGVAAHTTYKDEVNKPGARNDTEGRKLPGPERNAYRWLRQLVEMLEGGDNPEEFLEHTKLELFQDQVFCFTPKGRLIALPSGASPIDFAYAVHTDVGNTCVGCKINGRHAPLASELQNGDEVEIICSKAQTPPAAWERIAITGKARSAIRRSTRETVLSQYAALGREILQRAFPKAGEVYSSERIRKALGRMSQRSVEEVLAAVGRGELASEEVIRAVAPGSVPPPARSPSLRKAEEGWFNMRKALGLKFRIPGTSRERKTSGEAIPIRGMHSDLPVTFAKGGAVPGDRIVGIRTPGAGITIYPIHSQALKAFDDKPDRWIDVTWDIAEDSTERFPARFEITVINEPGALAQVAKVIGDGDGNIDNVRMVRRAPDFTVMRIDLEVWDIKHLNRILAELKGQSMVNSAKRITG